MKESCASGSGIMVMKQKTGPRKGAPDGCYHVTHPDRIQIAFDDHRLVASALAGGDCIDDADVLCAGGTARVLGFTAKAPSTLGTFLRSFRWGHARQLDRVSRELLARVWKTGAGPGDAPFTIDLDSTICETYGLAKEGARHHGYTGARGYHPLLAVGTGDVVMSRLREGRANTARDAAHIPAGDGGTGALRRGQRTTHATGRQRVLHSWRGIRLPQDGCPLLHHHPPAQEPAQSHRGDTRGCLDSHSLLDGRRRRCGRDHLHSLPEHLPSGRFAANGAWQAVQVMAHNMACWTARIGLGEQVVTTKTPSRRVFALAGRLTRSARRLTLHLPRRWPWEEQFSRALARLRAIPLPA